MTKINVAAWFFLVFLLQFYACMTPLYVPSSQGIPTVEKDEIAVQANVSLSDPSFLLVDAEFSCQISGTYGFAESASVHLAGSLGNNYDSQRKELRGGVGYTVDIDPTSYFQIHGLAGYQRQNIDFYRSRELRDWSKATSYSVGIQPGLFSKFNDTTIGLITSLKHFNYYNIVNHVGHKLDSKSELYLDPAFLLSRKFKTLAFNVELGLSQSFGENTRTQFYSSLGLAYHFKI